MPNRSVPWYMLTLNYFLPVYLLLGGLLAFNAPSILTTVLITSAWLYLVLPVCCRIVLIASGRPTGTVDESSRVFAWWWFISQLQILYSRVPLLEEILRIVPGLYSLWLRLWGARVSLLVYWSPGVHVFDRYHLTIQQGVLIGGGCRIGAHTIKRKQDGRLELIIAPMLIERGCTIGMNAAVGPGAHIFANETVPAGKMLRPFSGWRDSKEVRAKA